MDWKFLEEWGWVPRNGWNHHVYTEQPATPVDLLKFVRCKCKLFSKSPCLTNFSCKKWTILCCSIGHCHGGGCLNENLTKNLVDDICE